METPVVGLRLTMAKNTKGIEVRAYQILNHAGKMTGKKVMQKKLDVITALEIVERDSSGIPGAKGNIAFRIVEAVIDSNNGKILETETAVGMDGITLQYALEQVEFYKSMRRAVIKTKKDIETEENDEDDTEEEIYTGVCEVWLKPDKDRGQDEIYDVLYQMTMKAREQDGKIIMDIPEGFNFVGAAVPEDYAFLDD
jgi:hypothetical protein